MDFRDVSVEDLAARVRAGDVSARSLAQAALDRIARLDGRLGAFLAVDAERALAEADRVDARLAAGEAPALAGIPIGVKDLEDAAGYVTTHGSTLHVADEPATRDSILVARLKAAGCVVVGKTNTPELGVKAHSVNRIAPPTRNPWDLDCTAGGSSGGSAAAVAAGLVPLATASDGGGSIRIPAAACGLPGLKPALGRVAVGGPNPPGWPDLSAKGVLACRVTDQAAVLDCVVGPDPTDLTALPPPREAWRPQVGEPGLPARVGWSPTLGYAPVDADVRRVCEAALERLAAAGVEVVEVPTVFDQDPVTTWMALVGTANLRTVGHLQGTPAWDDLDPMLQYSAKLAADLSGVDLVEARDEVHRLNHRLAQVLGEVGLLLSPTIATRLPEPDGFGVLDGATEPNWVRFTYPFNLTRNPAGTVCAGLDPDGLPVGLQIVGPQHGDVAVLRAMASFVDVLGSWQAPLDWEGEA